MPETSAILTPAVLPYIAGDGGAMYPSRAEAQDTVRRLGLTNPAASYSRLLRWLRGNPRFDVRPLGDALRAVPAADRIIVSLRHDMDTEPYSSVEAARRLCAAGLAGSFYVLHTAEYYGQWHEGVFRRNGDIAGMLREIQDECGCEVGLHTDALWIYQRWRADGARGIVTELDWLRGEGLRVTGTAAHNSAPVYGGENFEIFRGRSTRDACTGPNGVTAPLQGLDEGALGIEYEANAPELEPGPQAAIAEWMAAGSDDPVRDPAWMRTYLLEHPVCRWGADYNLWLVGRDRWMIGGHRIRNGTFLPDASLDGVMQFVDDLAGGTRIVFHVHPLYIDFTHG